MYCAAFTARQVVGKTARHLQEVLAGTPSARRHSTPVIRHGAEDFEVRLEIFAERHDGGDVAAAVAVVGRRPDGDDFLRLEVVLVAFVDQLVGAGDEL
jgi:hypothetical protein